ncbi:hypothetical protein ABIA35_009097 [Catenulispora sp. MAP12-49]|uniref:hypothetical protein n=1 Tax=Catenulispora sp. MAP12-49 TaxID=3156302 RepID=UPI0035151E2D
MDDQEMFAALWAAGERLPEVTAWLQRWCQVRLDDRGRDPGDTRPGPVSEGRSPKASFPPEADTEFTFSASVLAAALDADQPLLKRWDAVHKALPRHCDNVIKVPDDPVGTTLRRVPHDLRTRVVDLAQEVIFTLPTGARVVIAEAFDDPDEARFFWHIDYHVMAGGGAWMVCFGARPEMAALVPSAVASEWLRIMLYYCEDCYTEGDLDMPRRVIAALISRIGPTEAASVIVDEISVLAPRYGDPIAIELLQAAWQPDLIRALTDRLDDASPECVRALLKPLLAMGTAAAATAARSILADESCPLGRRGLVAQAMLYSEDTCMTAIEALMRSEPLTRIALRHLNNHDSNYTDWPTAVAMQAPELLDRLHQHLDRLCSAGPGKDGEQERHDKDLLRQLPGLIARRRGQPVPWTIWELTEADELYDWLLEMDADARPIPERDEQGWSLTCLEQLAADPRHRIVDSSAQLLSVVVEALEAFHAELHGDIPLVSSLWDQTGTGRATFKPKNEAKLSDEIARWLRHSLADSGIVVNREVQVRRLRESAQSEAADIVVQATATGRHENTATVIIEVKGGWNRETLTAMRSQLTERYLAAHPDAAGLYLVGWYLCPEWDPEDRRRRTAHKTLGSIGSLRSELSSQAREIKERCPIHSQVLDLRLSSAESN